MRVNIVKIYNIGIPCELARENTTKAKEYRSPQAPIRSNSIKHNKGEKSEQSCRANNQIEAEYYVPELIHDTLNCLSAFHRFPRRRCTEKLCTDLDCPVHPLNYHKGA